MNKLNRKQDHRLVQLYDALIDNIISGKAEYSKNQGKDPGIVIVHPSVMQIIKNMEFLSDRVLIQKDKAPIIDGMAVYSHIQIEKGTATYADFDELNIDDSFYQKPTL